jgi:CheY-like chemotaxis protein
MEDKRLCILVVEDDADTLKLMVMLLRRNGFDVRAASTFEQAEELAPGCGLLVSDIGLGVGGGLELMRDLKSRYGLKGIAVSGHSEPYDLQDAEDAGFDRFIAKPISVDHLLKTIEQLTGQFPALVVNC